MTKPTSYSKRSKQRHAAHERGTTRPPRSRQREVPPVGDPNQDTLEITRRMRGFSHIAPHLPALERLRQILHYVGDSSDGVPPKYRVPKEGE